MEAIFKEARSLAQFHIDMALRANEVGAKDPLGLNLVCAATLRHQLDTGELPPSNFRAAAKIVLTADGVPDNDLEWCFENSEFARRAH